MFASLAVLGDPAARSEPTATGECALDVDLLVPRAGAGAYVDVAVVDAASGLVLSGFELDGALLEGDALEVEAELDGVVVGSRRSRAGDSFAGAGNLRLELPVEADGARRLALRVYDGAGRLRGAARGPAPASYAVSVSVGGNALGSTAPAFPVSSPAGGGRASVAWYDRFDLAVPWGAGRRGRRGVAGARPRRGRRDADVGRRRGAGGVRRGPRGGAGRRRGDARRRAASSTIAVTSFADAADLAVADRRALDAAIDGLEARPNLAHRVVGALDLLRDAAEDPPALVA
ncbi:hypothetical protein SO694_00087177 [Aureococcus anophagefferens]|uniref:Uncharacterized protein n=1 Tax=Aureococcus anophagefferens TaxID=44056 RepID=A0ABR1G555_AURAN